MSSAVRRSSVTEAHAQHNQLAVDRLVDDPVVADAQSAQARELALERRPGERLVCQPVDGFGQATARLALGSRWFAPPWSLGVSTQGRTRSPGSL